MSITAGEAAIRLLGKYGVDTVFGIPGVHTLDFYQGMLPHGPVQHVQARNEMGAGFMAEGYARTSGRPGVALVISGPGVTNAATALGQAYADSVPMLMLSSDAQSASLGKGWGVLHEVTDLHAVTRPLTALSRSARTPQDIPEFFAQAFSIFRSHRPRPVHISVPLDVLAAPVADDWEATNTFSRPSPNAHDVARAAELLKHAQRPLVMLGGGAADAELTPLVEALGAVVVTSTAGKGIVPDSHPLSLGAATVRPEARAIIAEADVVLAIGTELSETDSFVDRLDFGGKLIRIDIDPHKINDMYPPDVAIVADASAAVAALRAALSDHETAARDRVDDVKRVQDEIAAGLNDVERQHTRFLEVLRATLPPDCLVMADACQPAYTGAFWFPADQPRRWHYGAGYCPLGYALPNAIGAKLANPDVPVAVLAGDGGVMFTIQELVTAAQLGLAMPIIVWDNGGLQEIRDYMLDADSEPVGVDGLNPDFTAVAQAMLCDAVEPQSVEGFAASVTRALNADRPTLILVREGAPWLL